MSGSSRVPSTVDVPSDDFDVTITSTSDDEATVRAALNGGDDESDGDDAGDEDETPPVEKPKPAAADPAKGAKPAPAQDDDTTPEDRVPGETKDERKARIERNVRRVKNLAAKLGNKDQHIETLNDRLVRLERENTTLRGGKPAETTPAAPAEEDPKFAFKTWEEWEAEKGDDAKHEDWLDARTDARYAYNQQREARAAAREAQTRTTEQLLADHKTRLEDARSRYADYDQVINTSKSPLTVSALRQLVQMEKGADVAYHLALPENLADAQRIAGLTGLAETRALLQVEAQLAGTGEATPPKRQKPTAADDVIDDDDEDDEDEDDEDQPPARPASRQTPRTPDPVRRVRGTHTPARALSEMGTDDFIRARDEEDKRAGRRK